MKAMLLLSFMISAAALSLLAAFYASGRIETPTTSVSATNMPPSTMISTFPQQTRAVEDLLAAIHAREEALKRQELQLDEREAKLRQEEILLKRMRDELATTETAIAEHFREISEAEKANTRKLAEFYSKMDAKNASQLLMEMETNKAARIIGTLADRQAGAIMDATVAAGARGIEHAVAWSEYIRRQKQERARKKEEETTP